MGKVKRQWQAFEWILGLFDDRLGVARRRYKAFAAKSLLCYWAVRALGVSMAGIARRLN